MTIQNAAGSQSFISQVLADAATINWNVKSGQNASVTLGGNRTINVPSNMTAGMIITIRITSAGFQPVWAAGYLFPNGAPLSNIAVNAVDTYEFIAVSASELILTSYSSNVPNWENFDGTKCLNGQVIAFSGAATGGPTLTPIPGTSNVLLVMGFATTSVSAAVLTYDVNGRLTNTPGFSFTVISNTGIIAYQPMVCVLSDGLNAIISWVATVAAVQCQNLVSVGISGTTLTVGTVTQVRAAEAVAGPGSVRELDTTNFSLVFRTGTSNILYAYPCSVSGGVITVGGSPLTIETGNANTIDTSQCAMTATTTMLLFRSTVTLTDTYTYAAILTFSGTGSAPTINTPLNLSTSSSASQSRALKIVPLTGVSNKFVVCIKGVSSSGNLFVQVINNSSGTLSTAGSSVNITYASNGVSSALYVPDSGHAIASLSNSNSSNLALQVFKIDSSFNVTVAYAWYMNMPNVLIAHTFAPINNNKMGIFSFINGAGNNGLWYTTVKT